MTVPLPDFSFHEYIWAFRLILKGFEYLAGLNPKWKKERLEIIENRILDYLNTKAEPSNIHGIWADVFLKPVVGDIPFWVAFPPHRRGWQRIKLEAKRLPREVFWRWHIWRQAMPRNQVQSVLLKLLREGRIQYNPSAQLYSRKI